jgi:hypothetical protein
MVVFLGDRRYAVTVIYRMTWRLLANRVSRQARLDFPNAFRLRHLTYISYPVGFRY